MKRIHGLKLPPPEKRAPAASEGGSKTTGVVKRKRKKKDEAPPAAAAMLNIPVPTSSARISSGIGDQWVPQGQVVQPQSGAGSGFEQPAVPPQANSKALRILLNPKFGLKNFNCKTIPIQINSLSFRT